MVGESLSLWSLRTRGRGNSVHGAAGSPGAELRVDQSQPRRFGAPFGFSPQIEVTFDIDANGILETSPRTSARVRNRR